MVLRPAASPSPESTLEMQNILNPKLYFEKIPVQSRHTQKLETQSRRTSWDSFWSWTFSPSVVLLILISTPNRISPSSWHFPAEENRHVSVKEPSSSSPTWFPHHRPSYLVMMREPGCQVILIIPVTISDKLIQSVTDRVWCGARSTYTFG